MSRTKLNIGLGDNPKKKFAVPTATAKLKDNTLPPEKLCEVSANELTSAKNAVTMKPIQCRFVPDGPDRTIAEDTVYGKTVKVEGMNAQMSIYELRQTLAKQENLDLEDINFFSRTSYIPSEKIIGELFVDWAGSGFDAWPPALIVKPRVRGFEVTVYLERCRDTSTWQDGKLNQYMDKEYQFDVEPTTTIRELKDMIFKRTNIPADRQTLTAQIHETNRSFLGEFVSLDDDARTMSDYGVDGFCARITLEKSPFDANGMFVFDDAYFDSDGYHPQPLGAWIPQDSIQNRSRPDAPKNDPAAPAMILTDRAAAAVASSD